MSNDTEDADIRQYLSSIGRKGGSTNSLAQMRQRKNNPGRPKGSKNRPKPVIVPVLLIAGWYVGCGYAIAEAIGWV